MWGNSESDFLSALKAVEACRYAIKTTNESVVSFAQKHSLHQQSLEEILKLRSQLCAMLSEPLDGLVPPPTPSQQMIIRQVIAGGLADQVARKLSPEEVVSVIGQKYGKNARMLPTYVTLTSDEFVHIHPTSFLTREAPDYITYHEVVSSKKTYMRGITRIQPGWLLNLAPTLATLSDPLSLPPPRFDSKMGQVKCFVRVNYGPKHWPLPMQLVPYPETQERYRFFMQFILQGAVLKDLAQFTESLSVRPATTTRCANRKVLAMLEVLIRARVDNRAKLMAKLNQEPEFLLKQYLAMIPDVTKHSQITEVWKGIH